MLRVRARRLPGRLSDLLEEAWLRPVGTDYAETVERDDDYARLEALARENTVRKSKDADGATLYRCQATEFLRATRPLKYWDLRSFLREVTSRNVKVWTFVRVFAGILRDEPRRRTRGMAPFDKAGNGTQPEPLGLVPGARVRIRSKEEVGETLNESGRLRGLWFDREMLPYCGETATVKAKVERFIEEGPGG